MSSFLPASIQKLIEEFGRLPGVGPKSAQRLAMHLLHSPDGRVHELAEAVDGLKKGLQFCNSCWNIAEGPVCRICAAGDAGERNGRQICVVEEILDVVAIEKTLEFKGVYHVLHGALSPVDGIGPDQLKIEALVERVRGIAESGSANGGGSVDDVGSADGGGAQHLMSGQHQMSTLNVGPTSNVEISVEIILATNPGLEGETTAMYLMRLLKPFSVKITRIARGLPVGGDLDYADELTLTKSLQGRAEYV